MPRVRPVSVADVADAGTLTSSNAGPWTLYPVMGLPPSDAGGDHETSPVVESTPVVEMMRGASGAVGTKWSLGCQLGARLMSTVSLRDWVPSVFITETTGQSLARSTYAILVP